MLQQQPTPDGTPNGQYTYEKMASHVSMCPDCDGDVVDGQGLMGCVDCDWAGIVA